MWETVSIWNSSKDKWLNGKFDEIDAVYVERFMDEGLKKL